MSNSRSPTTLVNFKIFPKSLEPFDRVCFLEGKTRTQVLIELIEQYVLQVGPMVERKLEDTDLLNDRLKTAVERLNERRTSIEPVRPANRVESRLKRKLSSFAVPEPIKRGWSDALKIHSAKK